MKTNAEFNVYLKDGEYSPVWKGGLFASFSGEIFREKYEKDVFSVKGFKLRYISRIVSDGAVYCDKIVVMQESWLARCFGFFFNLIWNIAYQISRIEKFIFRLDELDNFPKYSLACFIWKKLYFTE